MSANGADGDLVNATAVAVGGQAVLIVGAPGSGKSTLAAEMIAQGADLVADDQVIVSAGDGLSVSAPARLSGLLEIRGFGLIRLEALASAPLRLVADLDQAESERLPPHRVRDLSEHSCQLMLCKGRPRLAAALACILKARDWLDPDAPIPPDRDPLG